MLACNAYQYEVLKCRYPCTGELESKLQTAETAVASLEAQLDSANASLTAKSLETVQLREELGEQLRMARQQIRVGFRVGFDWMCSWPCLFSSSGLVAMTHSMAVDFQTAPEMVDVSGIR